MDIKHNYPTIRLTIEAYNHILKMHEISSNRSIAQTASQIIMSSVGLSERLDSLESRLSGIESLIAAARKRQ